MNFIELIGFAADEGAVGGAGFDFVNKLTIFCYLLSLISKLF